MASTQINLTIMLPYIIWGEKKNLLATIAVGGKYVSEKRKVPMYEGCGVLKNPLESGFGSRLFQTSVNTGVLLQLFMRIYRNIPFVQITETRFF